MWLVATIVNNTILTWLIGLGHEDTYFLLLLFFFFHSITLKNNGRQIWEQTGGGIATHSSILIWRILMDREAWRARVQGVTKSWTELSD